MEILSAAALHVRGGKRRGSGWYCPRVVVGGVCRQLAYMPSNTGEVQVCNLYCVQREWGSLIGRETEAAWSRD